MLTKTIFACVLFLVPVIATAQSDVELIAGGGHVAAAGSAKGRSHGDRHG